MSKIFSYVYELFVIIQILRFLYCYGFQAVFVYVILASDDQSTTLLTLESSENEMCNKNLASLT
jgi:hypothetical protein